MPIGGIAEGIGNVIASNVQAGATKSAARTAANASLEAARISREAADQSRVEILNRLTPALTDFNRAMTMAGNDIKTGAADVMQILNQSTENASDILASTGVNASKALLGSRAFNSGVSRTSFEDSFARIEAAPADQRSAMIEREYGIPPGEQSKYSIPATGTPAATTGMRQVSPTTMGGVATSGQGGTSAGYSPTGEALSNLTVADFMTDVPTGRMVKNPDYIGGEGYNGQPQEIWKPYTDEERQQMGYEAWAATGAQAKLDAARAEELANLGARDPRLADVAALETPQGSDYLPSATTGTYEGGPGYYTSVEEINKGTQGGLAALASGAGTARSDIMRGLEAGRAAFQPYAAAGENAINMEAALSGALGPEAQQMAQDAFIESPGQKYLREQQEKTLLRNTAAIGGLGGGNVRTALQEQAYGIAAQQQQQYLENLRSIASRGQDVAGSIAGLESSAANNLAQIANALGVNSSQLINMNQQQLAALAERTGVRLSDIQSAVGAAQAELMNKTGASLAGVAGSTAGDLAGLTERTATGNLQAETDIATKLANLATLSASQSAQYTNQAGSNLAAGTYLSGQQTGQAISGVGNTLANIVSGYQQQTTTPTTTTQNVSVMPATGAWSSYQPVANTYTGTGMSR